MQIRIGSRKKIQFTDKVHPAAGIVSVVFGVLSLALLITLFVMSCQENGAAGDYVGVLGILVCVVSIIGFIMAVRCYRREEVYLLTPTIGSVINGFLVIICMILYIIGTV